MMVVTELCEGGDLAKALVRDTEEPRLLGWYQRGHCLLLDVAYGLAYLHSNKVGLPSLKRNSLSGSAFISARESRAQTLIGGDRTLSLKKRKRQPSARGQSARGSHIS